MHLLLLIPLFRLPGYSTLSGPKAVSGPKGGSLTVRCSYGPGWETYYKWWCRGAVWNSCKILVKTTGSEKEEKKGGISIRDSQKNRTFDVTMEKLKEGDADVYWCGIERIGTDLGVQVEVSVGPAPTTMWTTTTSTNTTFTVPATPEETTASPTMTSQRSDVRSKILQLKILIPLVCAVLLLLLVAASLLAWSMKKRQKKGAVTSSEQPLESDLCYAHLTLHHSGTSLVSSRKKASTMSASSAQANQAEVEYVTMAPFPREEISYASLPLDTLNQEPTYTNMGHHTARIPTRSHEEPTEYSSIRSL
ncbi:CMRF35-like molecule 1 isoform X1 [Elephas maximus indicus]|uniref:CMRF35-like molecule 1 isoform X1 n=1 Tax=Elephas maximus indicus TaxID=99487 RepID=UPI002116CB60|nr:CMRF35-like molecule 1 isoform X1 [Elephas maximus indicus]